MTRGAGRGARPARPGRLRHRVAGGRRLGVLLLALATVLALVGGLGSAGVGMRAAAEPPVAAERQLVRSATDDLADFSGRETGKGCASGQSNRTVTEPRRAGTAAFRHEVQNCGERAEVRDRAVAIGSETWTGWSVYLPRDYDPGDWVILNQMAAYPSANKWPCGGVGHKLSVRADGKVGYDLQRPTSGGGVTCDKRELPGLTADTMRGVWTDFVLHAEWTADSDGFLELWAQVDGDGYRKVIDWVGPVWPANEGRGPYFKMGAYTGDPRPRGRDVVVYTDEYRQGDSRSRFADVAPDGASGPTGPGSATPTPTASPDPTATPSSTPDPTATPTATPDPTATPTATPDPTATPAPTPSSPVPTGTYVLRNACADKLLDVARAGTADGTGVLQWRDNGGAHQRWQVEAVGEGYHRLTAQHSGKVLDVERGEQRDGARVQQWSYAGNPQQQWKFVAAGDGWWELTPRSDQARALDVAGAATTDGADVWSWTRNGTCAQRWKLESTAPTPGPTATPAPTATPDPTPSPSPSTPAPSPTPTTSPRPADDIARYGRFGLNQGTGYFTDPAYVDRAVARMQELGLKRVRMGMDGVNGRSVGAGFTWAGRDYVVDAYTKAGIAMHVPISFRGMVDGDDLETRKRNWEHFVREVMQRYRGKISYYIIDNEPDIAYGPGWNQAQPAEITVQFNAIAYRVAKEVDPSIRIESSPAGSPCTTYNRDMLAAGLGKHADVIGTHIYGGQINDNEDCIGRLRSWMTEFGVDLPIAISEAGSIVAWAPEAGEEGRAQWYRDLAAYAKRHQVENVLAFDWNETGEWRMEDTPSLPAWAEAARTTKY